MIDDHTVVSTQRSAAVEKKYDAFISYPSSLRTSAKRLNSRLRAIAKEHPDTPQLTIFLDESALQPGTLTERIYGPLRASRYLIVLLGVASVKSEWVAEEINYWLDNGGSTDRLVLVHVDRKLRLTWEKEGGYFPTGTVPVPLERAFTAEQKWIDFTRSRFGRQRHNLTSLCATLLDTEPESFLVHEAELQQRRTRRLWAVIAAIALLFVAAVVLAVVALINADAARRNATEAQAQAAAAESLLTTPLAPTRGIDTVLEAAALSESPTVRSAMLAVLQDVERLDHAYVFPETETGHPVAGAAFSLDGTRLVAWGNGPDPGTSLVQAWNTLTKDVEFALTVPALNLTQLVVVGGHSAACSTGGPVLIDLVSGQIDRDETSPVMPLGAACTTYVYDGGVVALAAGGQQPGYALWAGSSGGTQRIEGINAVATNRQSRYAVAGGPSGIVVLTNGAVEKVGAQAAVPFALDAAGKAITLTDDGFVFVDSNARTVSAAPDVPDTLAAFAPVVVSGQMTDEIAWITDKGLVGWTRDDRTLQLSGTGAANAVNNSSPNIDTLDGGQFIAVYGGIATVLQAPASQYTVVDEWTRLGDAIQLGAADDVVADRCDGFNGIVLTGTVPTGALLVRTNGETHAVSSGGSFTTDCAYLSSGEDLSLVSRFQDPILLRVGAIADSFTVNPVDGSAAVVKAGFPIEVLSGVSAGELPRPWLVGGGTRGEVTALGEVEMSIEGTRLVTTDGAGERSTVAVPDFSRLLGVRPDGRGAVITSGYRPGATSVIENGEMVIAEYLNCTEGFGGYYPGPDFRDSLADAEAQLPGVPTEAGIYDCRTGRPILHEAGREILDYQIGADQGRIVSSLEGRVTVTTWNRGDGESLRTIDAPVSADMQGTFVSFDDDASLALTYSTDGRRLALHSRVNDAWDAGMDLVTSLPEIASAQVVDDGTLLLAVSATGGFELFDTASGRVVASDASLGAVADADEIVKVTVRRVGDDLIVTLLSPDTISNVLSRAIQIPVGVDTLREHLCQIYAAPACAS